ncbi:hypothetical protein GCM10009792_08520 [Microcella alkalica]|uniref:DUF4287 domain-containing protein n=1 Tax=Microcella alkalica TaxID=355930 RepID=A0A839E2K4_9MICO|nr:hypothetical protein [Microcella alkalica]MBA8846591.1 hypothetical protein [Microcella alkalica]
MTTQEAFKKRVRERMQKTGERYGAARRALIEAARARDAAASAADGATTASPARVWVAQPQHSDELVREKTGRGWDAWVDAIDAGPGRAAGHPAIAAWLVAQGVDDWWAQGVTVGYERITGLRLPGQMPDGTFTVSRSRIVAMAPEEARAMIHDDDARAALLPGFETVLRSRPGVRSPGFELRRDGELLGRVTFAFDPAPGGRTTLTVAHAKLPTLEEGDHWKAFWAEWLAALEEAGTTD